MIHNHTMRQFYDVKVYLNPPEDLRRAWKIKRDTTKRGYTVDEVQAEMEKREPDLRDFIRPQRQYADIVVLSPETRVYRLSKPEHNSTLSSRCGPLFPTPI
ncbi:MAG: hypothetical protein U0074_15990 [Kouleothrix sp.]